MREIHDLQSQLARLNSETFRSWDAPGVTAMAMIADGLADKASKSSMASTRPERSERMRLAVRYFQEENGAVDFGSLRIVTFACCHWFDADQYSILADAAMLQTLLSRVTDYQDNPRTFRRLYVGLLSSFLTADRYSAWFSELASSGFELLRSYLSEKQLLVVALQPPLQRLEALNRFPQVLDFDAGQYFAARWLAGEHDEFKDVTEKLQITGASWLAAETLKAALREAITADDEQFKIHMPTFLQAAAEPRFQPIRDDLYVGLLSRYAAIPSPPAHPGLRDALVAAWKNPWMSRNDGAWGSVTDHARKMVAGWLKREFIHQFFEVFSDDGRQDRRRFEFWLTYCDQMDDVYFALGNEAYRSDRSDLVKLRAALDGRLLELTGVSLPTHAFLMCIGGRVVVEFSQNANAVHTFPRAELESISKSRAVHISELKIATGDSRWIHRGPWEDDFRRRLTNQPPTRKLSETAPLSRPGFSDANPLWSAPSRSQSKSRNSIRDGEIFSFANFRNIPFDDRRARGGNLWLMYEGQDRSIVQRLESWGFSYAPTKGWWRDY